MDVDAQGGGVSLSDTEVVETLRAWHDEGCDDFVEYRFTSTAVLKVWSVHTCEWPGGRTTDEKWIGPD
jgi:hypothetical protein